VATRGLIYLFHALFYGAMLLRLAPKASAAADAAAVRRFVPRIY